MRRLLTRVMATLVVVFTLTEVEANAALPPAKCPSPSGTIARKGGGPGLGAPEQTVVWHRGSSLYVCSSQQGLRVNLFRAGPWSAASRAAFDGNTLVWTVRMRAAHRVTDRVFATYVPLRDRWMTAQKPNPGGASLAAREDRVARLVVNGGNVVGWATIGGAVVAAVRSMPGARITPIGTPQAAPQILQQHLVPLGRYPRGEAASIATSLQAQLDPQFDAARFRLPWERHAHPRRERWLGSYDQLHRVTFRRSPGLGLVGASIGSRIDQYDFYRPQAPAAARRDVRGGAIVAGTLSALEGIPAPEDPHTDVDNRVYLYDTKPLRSYGFVELRFDLKRTPAPGKVQVSIGGHRATVSRSGGRAHGYTALLDHPLQWQRTYTVRICTPGSRCQKALRYLDTF